MEQVFVLYRAARSFIAKIPVMMACYDGGVRSGFLSDPLFFCSCSFRVLFNVVRC
ncbi:hypothetical protein B488_07860 [Liberibacter crescens BT-1]|uniref:Uncharacterized protein n=2 Tax=Liberibacter crescens TaxID=1273132 RepID=L0EVS9_LIBCB|nr:hypothetical protein B488_07860 [Liberibacter crescens BT-1]